MILEILDREQPSIPLVQLQLIESYLALGDKDKALSKAGVLDHVSMSDPFANYLRAALRFLDDHPDQGRQKILAISAMLDATSPLQLKLVSGLIRYQEWSAAKEILIRIIDSGRHHPELFFMLGICLVELGEFREAINAFEHSISLEPFQADAYCRIGGAYIRLDDSISAIKALRRAVELQPGHYQATRYLTQVMGLSDYYGE